MKTKHLCRSLVDLAGSSKDNSNLDPIITEMYKSAELDEDAELNFDEFKRLLTSKDENFMLKVGVDWKGAYVCHFIDMFYHSDYFKEVLQTAGLIELIRSLS